MGEPTLFKKVVDPKTKKLSTKPPIGLWPRRVVLWDNRRKMLISGVKAPTVKGLVETLSRNRQVQVYYGETVEYESPAPASRKRRGGHGR